MEITKSIPISYYTKICMVLVFIPYYLILFTWWGNPAHGPGPWSSIVVDSFLVVGLFASIDLIRSYQTSWKRILTMIVGFPLLFGLGLRVYFAVTNYYLPWLFT